MSNSEKYSHLKYNREKQGGFARTIIPNVLPMDALKNLEVVPCLEKGETDLSPNSLSKKVRKSGCNVGHIHGEYLLEHQELIPIEFQTYYLLFPDPIWEFKNHSDEVFALRWDGEKWGPNTFDIERIFKATWNGVRWVCPMYASNRPDVPAGDYHLLRFLRTSQT